MAYDLTGAMGGLFAPAYIHGNPESEASVKAWQAENFALTPADIEATRGPSQTITNPGVGSLGRGGGSTTTSIPGSVDPAALRILAQGGKYTPKAAATSVDAAAPVVSQQRDAITQQLLGAGRIPNATAGSLIAPRSEPLPAGQQYAYSPLIGLMGEGDSQGFFSGGSFPGGA